jgi:peptidoglycan/xylan/chitin deacetylase (PgdA/CDA1 family)
MVGQAVERHPELAKEIVQRGHEATGHGQTWEPQYSMTPEQERAGYARGRDDLYGELYDAVLLNHQLRSRWQQR